MTSILSWHVGLAIGTMCLYMLVFTPLHLSLRRYMTALAGAGVGGLRSLIRRRQRSPGEWLHDDVTDGSTVQHTNQQPSSAVEQKQGWDLRPEPAVPSSQGAERELQRQALLFNALLDAVLITGPDLRITDCNPAAEHLFGYPKEEMLGRDAALFYASPNADLQQAVLVALQENGRWRGEIPVLHKDGAETIADVAIVAHTEAGEPDALVVVSRDISDRKAAEEALSKSEQQLLQSQKMEAIGRLAGAIAHDFNNMLTVIKGFSALLEMDTKEDDLHYAYIKEIENAADHSATLTHQLLAFSRKQVLQPEIMDLNSVVSRVGTMLQRLIGEHISLQTALDPTLSNLFADPGQLEQVLINLAVNARDAMPDGGSLLIQTSNAIVHEEHRRRLGLAESGAYVMLLVRDTGCGMTPEVRQQVFEPFFTTKEQGKGTGLGLATVYGIVRQSGGQISVESEVGVGTTFRVYLPRSQEALESKHESPGFDRIATGSETILLVEDEAAVRRFTRTVLVRSGYKVLEASDGLEALRLMEEHGDSVHLLLSDVVMPQMSGKLLAERILERQEALAVLFMSGYTDDAIEHHGVLAPGTFFLEKPFTPDVLTRKVREVIDAARGHSGQERKMSLSAPDWGWD